MTNFVSSFAQFMQSDVDDTCDSPKTLFDFITSHKSVANEDGDIKSLSDLTSKCLSLKEENKNISNHFSAPVGLESFKISIQQNNAEKSETETSDEFTSLEEYTKSYLTSKGNSILLCRITGPHNSKFQHNSNNGEKEKEKSIDERLTSISLSDTSDRGRKIDLTAALLNTTKNYSTSSYTDTQNQTLQKKILYSLKECIHDISSLAEENMLYSDAELSYFGHVISRKWDHQSASKKYRRLGRIHPYNIASSFKFDVPSPDDDAKKYRTRNDSNT